MEYTAWVITRLIQLIQHDCHRTIVTASIFFYAIDLFFSNGLNFLSEYQCSLCNCYGLIFSLVTDLQYYRALQA